MKFFSSRSVFKAFAILGTFVALAVTSDAAFANLNVEELVSSAELTALKTAAENIVKALVGVALVLLVGRAILRALQIRP